MNKKRIFILFYSMFILLLCYTAVIGESSMDIKANNFYSTAGMRESLQGEMHFWVYVKSGDKVYIGTSAKNRTTDVTVKQPSGATTNYNVTDTSPGYIPSRIQEVYGPNIFNANGYNPIIVNASGEGLMQVILYPSNGEIGISLWDPWNHSDSPSSDDITHAWGIHVVNSAGQEKTGRVFSSNLTFMDEGITDGLSCYLLTNDGYLYQVDTGKINGINWGLGGVNLGIKHRPTDSFTYSSVVHGGWRSSYMPGLENFFSYNLKNQNFEYSSQDYIAYRLFLKQPDADLRKYLGIQNAKATPTIRNFKFTGNVEGNKTLQASGGTFSFDTDVDYGTYEIELAYNETSQGNAQTTAPIRYSITTGGRLKNHNEYKWDGKDNQGNIVPPGSYSATVTIKAGEIHFLFSDIEKVVDGILITHLSDNGNTHVYYDNMRKVIGGHSTHMNEYICHDNELNSECHSVNIIESGGMLVDKNDPSLIYLYGPAKYSGTGRVLKSDNGYTDGLNLDVWTYYRTTRTYTTPYIVVNPVTIQKSWDDQNNALNTRPSSLVFEAYNGNTLAGSCTANASSSWKCMIDNLSKTDNSGRTITYTIKEKSVPNGYTGNTATVIAENAPTVTITNKLQLKNITVTKSWSDQNNKFSTRPSSIIFDAFIGNGTTSVGNCTANASNSWKCTISNLAKIDSAGRAISYTIKERSVPSGYTGNTASVTSESGTTATVTNTLQTKNITVTKSWVDDNNKNNTRPSSIIFDVFIGNGTTSVGNCTANASNSWKCTISNLAKVDSAGKAISYTIKERTVPSGYSGTTASVTSEAGTTATVTNTLQLKNITVTKTWDDQNNKFNTRPSSIIFDAFAGSSTTSSGNCTANASNSWKCTISNLAKTDSSGKAISYTIKERTVPSGYTQTAGSVTTADGTTATVKNTLQTKAITVTKSWSDQNNKFSTRPSSIVFDVFIGSGTTSFGNCTANASNSWKCTISNLAKVDSANKAISYTIKERTVPSGYTQKTGSVTTADGTTATVTNTLETKNITVTKSWSDQDNKFSTRPSSIIFDAFIGNGTTSVGNCTANASNAWKCTISNLAKVDSANKAITYTVKERTVPSGYTQKTGSVTTANGTAATVTNTLQTKNITVTKTWDDQNNKFSTRPASIIFDAFIGNGTTSVGNCTANASSAWKCTISNLAKVDSANKAITYTVKERTVPSGYTQKTGSVTTADGTAAAVTNTLQTKNITVTKTWDDQNNKFSTRPASIIFDIYIGNGTTSLGNCTANASNSWKCTFSNLAKLDSAGKAISYTVKERTTPTGYKGATATVNTEAGTTAAIKNTLETVSLTVVKQWDDDNNRDNYRVSSISFDVYAGKEKQLGGPYTISEKNNWKTTVSGLPKYNSSGKEIVYSVKEIR